jgi:hypothetical protein
MEGGVTDIISLEGKIREFFRIRDSKGLPIKEKEVKKHCRTHISDVSHALEVANRVIDWLKNLGVRIWY